MSTDSRQPADGEIGAPAEGAPEIDGTETIDEVLRLLPAPVAVIGVAGDSELGGLTAAWLTRVSHDPPLVVVSIGHQRHSYQMLRESDRFAVSILAADQVEEGRLFGLHSRRDVDKWARVDHILLSGGAPALSRCSGRFLCLIRQRITAGDHDLFVGEVSEAAIVAGAPALLLRGEDFAP